MKKLLTATALVAGLAVSGSASQTDAFLYLSGAQVDAFEESVQIVKLGIGADKTLDNGVMFGYKFGAYYGKLKEETGFSSSGKASHTGIELDLHLGYNIYKGLSAYGIAGVTAHSLGDNESGRGLGFGGGVSYKIFDSFAIAGEYKTYSMETIDADVGFDYDYDVAEVQLRWLF